MIEIKHTLAICLQYHIQYNRITKKNRDFKLMLLGIASSSLFERNLYMYRCLFPMFILGIEDCVNKKLMFSAGRTSRGNGKTTFKKYHALGSAINLLTGEI